MGRGVRKNRLKNGKSPTKTIEVVTRGVREKVSTMRKVKDMKENINIPPP